MIHAAHLPPRRPSPSRSRSTAGVPGRKRAIRVPARAPDARPVRAHVGYRGHILTKSRAYSTTYAALRAERAHHLGHTEATDTVTERNWRYVGSGHTPGAAHLAAGIAADMAESRWLAAEKQQEGVWCG
ncbi:replication initiator [Streptomyces chartreusis]|uniref:replication initiator n=1 Tax=Streptomyces chartreusis TaxID=1969 RepID=UPI00364AF188